VGVNNLQHVGASEVGMLASSDGQGPGMLLNDDCAVIELLDSRGTAVQPGERFERVVVTPLTRTTVPVFRYEIADVGTLIDGKGPFRRISDIDGRARSFLTWPTGKLHPAAFSAILATNPSIEKYQIRQTINGIDLVLVQTRSASPIDLNTLETALVTVVSAAVPTPKIEIRIVDAIARTGSASKHHSVLPISDIG
jgi:phenylacetate-coenzyme A ligase PaaK-like adenylate-forming protein